MIAAICAGLSGLGSLLWAIAGALLMAAAVLAAGALWAAILYGAARVYKNWRLYSPHPLAKRIRAFLRQRRQAKAARG